MASERPTPVVRFVSDDSDYEPKVKDVRIRTVWIRDGKGGSCCFDISEVNDLVKSLSGFMQGDAPPVEIIDLTKSTAV